MHLISITLKRVFLYATKKYSVLAILLFLNFACEGSLNLAGAKSDSKLSQSRPEQHTPRHGNRQVVDLDAASKKSFELKRSKSEFAERRPVSWMRYFACYARKTPAQAAKKGEKYAIKAGSSKLDATVSTTTKTKRPKVPALNLSELQN
jgi:hypothetical protein